MRTVIISLLMGLLTIVWGCALPPLDHTRQEILYEDGKVQKFSYAGDIFGPNQGPGESGQFREAIDVLREVDPSVLPNLADLPATRSKRTKIKPYTGLIQNFTGYDISIPSGNSGATLVVPARGWLEYVNWEPNVRLKGFVNGKQVYNQDLRVQPGKFKYMGNSYDFVAEIQPPPELAPEVKPYCPPRAKPKPKKRKKRIICPT
jgi:hypothetical protein